MIKVILFYCFLITTGFSEEEEFDFGEEGEEEGSTLRLPFRAKVKLDLGRQIGEVPRWIILGPSAFGTLDWQYDKFGKIYGEANIRHNQAFAGDPQIVRDEYTNEFTIREIYYQNSWDFLSISLGRRIVTWGEADILTLFDVISPADRRDLLFAKPEASRLGQDLALIDIWLGDIQITSFYSPRAKVHLLPKHFHPYGSRIPKEPKNNRHEWGIRVKPTPKSSAIIAQVHYRDPLIEVETLQTSRLHPKYTVIGYSDSAEYQNFLFKAEIAYFFDYPYQLGHSIKKVNTQAYLLGVDYKNAILGDFIFETNFYKKDKLLPGATNDFTFGFFWTKSFINEQLTFNFGHISLENLTDFVELFELSYQLSDNWQVQTQFTWIKINNDESKLQSLKNHNRIDLSLSYAFDLDS